MPCYECTYIIESTKKGSRLVCKTCGRFYGYIKDDDSMNEIREAVDRFGYYNPNNKRGNYQ